MIPAIMVMMLAVICGFLPAMNIVSEKESGTIEQMMSRLSAGSTSSWPS
jgi:ABC-2 type transport system permease protein